MKYKIESQKADPVRECTGSAFFVLKYGKEVFGEMMGDLDGYAGLYSGDSRGDWDEKIL